jgi:peptidoglycan/xylan/chitin deacetylase (PgdA/CDA1 family)
MIFLYHGIVPDDSPAERLCVGQAITLTAFKRHCCWLNKHYRIITLAEYLTCQKYEFNKRKPIALTFDDGYRSTFECVHSFLAENNIPTTFFVSTSHLEHGELLWFSYLKALCFEDLYEMVKVNQHTFPLQTITQRKWAWNELRILAKGSGNPMHFSRTLGVTYPLTRDVSALYEGMTFEQIKLAVKKSNLEVGAHTINHPYLDRMNKEEQENEIAGSKRVLSELTGRPIRYFAYPGGEYNHDTVELVKAAGYEASFAVISKKIGLNPQFEISRVGIYSQSLLKLQLKALGVADWARKFGLRIG